MTQAKKDVSEGMNKEAPHGLPIKVLAADGTSIETVVFASARKEPKLLGIIKEIDNLQQEMQEKQSEAEMLPFEFQAIQAELEDAENSDPSKLLDKAKRLRKKGDALTREIQDAFDKRIQKICDFFEAGLKAAGYSGDVLERHYSFLSVEKYEEIRLICMTGCGSVDFTKEGA